MPNKKFRTIFLEDWAPAIITGIVGGAILAFAVPWANSIFEKQRLFQERQTRILESSAELFAGLVSHFGKIRALEQAISDANKKLASSKDIDKKRREELETYIDKRGEERLKTEMALYALIQKLEANIVLTKLFFEGETEKRINRYKKWYKAQGEKPIQAKDLQRHAILIMQAMVKETKK